MRFLFIALAIFVATPVTIACAMGCDGDQRSMNDCAHDGFVNTDKELNKLYKQITDRLKSNNDTLKRLVATQKAWLAFRDAECAFMSSGNEQGSIYPMLIFECQEKLTGKRVEDLKAYLKCEEGDLSCPVPTQ